MKDICSNISYRHRRSNASPALYAHRTGLPYDKRRLQVASSRVPETSWPQTFGFIRPITDACAREQKSLISCASSAMGDTLPEKARPPRTQEKGENRVAPASPPEEQRGRRATMHVPPRFPHTPRWPSGVFRARSHGAASAAVTAFSSNSLFGQRLE